MASALARNDKSDEPSGNDDVEKINPATLLRLPDELLRVIFLHLDARSACSLGQTCSRLHRVLEEHAPLWKQLCIRSNLATNTSTTVGCSPSGGCVARTYKNRLKDSFGVDGIKTRWMRGDYSHLSTEELDRLVLPVFSPKLSADDWGEMLEAEMSRG